MYGVRKCSSFILLHVAVQFSQHHLLKRLFSPLYILAFFVKDKVPIGAWIYLWAFYFVPLIYISIFVLVPYCVAIPLLGIYTEETRIERDTCTPMFIAALFVIARTWKQPRCPSADEWIRKLWYINTMEYYSAIKKYI